MNYYIKTQHQDGNDYVCVKTDSINAAIDYAIGASKTGFRFPLFIESEDGHEMCVVVNSKIYQEQSRHFVRFYAETFERASI